MGQTRYTHHIDFDSIDITDDLMFGTVFQDTELCRRLIEMVLDIDVARIRLAEPQEPLGAGPLSRAGIVDLLVEDDEGNRIDIEMQNRPDANLPFRARHYLSLLDAMSLRPGQGFEEAHKAIVVFICTRDPFGRGWKRYNFPRACAQDGRPLGDGTDIVFVNARGTKGRSSTEFDAFLRYLLDHNDIETDYVRDLDERVRAWRDSPLWRRYRVFWSEKYRDDFAQARRRGHEEGHKEGREEGLAEGRKVGQEEGEARQLERMQRLAACLEAEDRGPELLDAMQDPQLLKQLLDEFDIS